MIPDFFNNQSKLSDGVGLDIIRAIYKAIDNDQKEAVQTLVSFTFNILNKSFNKNLNTYSQFIVIPSYYYFKGYSSGKFLNLCTDAAQSLTDLIRFHSQISVEKSKSFSELKDINLFVYQTFRGYSHLLYQIVKNNDIKSFIKVIDKYNSAFSFLSLSYPSYFPKKNHVLDKLGDEYDDMIKEFNKISDFHRRIKFAIMCWLWFLYDLKLIKKDDLLQFTDLITFDSISLNDLIDDFLFYHSNSFGLFDWDSWDYTERKEMQVFSPPQPENWLTFGFALFSLQKNSMYDSNYNKFVNNEIVRWLPKKLESAYKKILDVNNNWIEIIFPNNDFRPDTATIKQNINKILFPFYKLKRSYERSIDQIILSQSLSLDKTLIFKNGIYNSFIKNSSIREAFYKFNNIDHVKSLENKSKDVIEFNSSFKKAKMMFVEEKNQHIFNTEDIGGILARNIDDRFINKLKKIKTPKDYNNIIKALDDSLSFISNKKFCPDLILTDSRLAFSVYDLSANSKFVPSWQIKGKRESVFDVGFYDKIPIFSVFGNSFLNSILVCDFKKSFKAYELISDNYFNNLLDISVSLFSDNQANEIYDENPKDWEKNEDGILLSRDEAIELIKLDVNIKIHYEVLFEILDIDAFEIISINKTSI